MTRQLTYIIMITMNINEENLNICMEDNTKYFSSSKMKKNLLTSTKMIN